MSTSMLHELESILSESRNPNTMDLDTLCTADILRKINHEDKLVAHAVELCIEQIGRAVDAATRSLKNKGRLIYQGAGTSGRLGILDAVECRPTFSVADDLVIGLIAGGEKALIHAVEGAEDNIEQGKQDLININLNANDMLIGIAASGRTPYVIGGLNYATQLGCATATIVCNPSAPLLQHAQIGICAAVGPECLTGSTRMKSGTAQKLILNMLSTTVMIKLGKTYQNLMVDLNASNKKLVARATRIVIQATGCSETIASEALQNADNSAKLAILMVLTGKSAFEAKQLLEKNQGYLRNAHADAD